MDLILYTKGEFTVSLLPSFVFALSRRLLSPDTRALPASAREDASSHFSAAQLENVVGGGANGLEKESRINLISRSRLSDEAASSSSLSCPHDGSGT